MTKESIRTVLLVEDNPADARSLREMLDKGGSHETELTHVKRLTEAETYLAQHAVEIILLDLGLPDAQGLEAVRRLHAAAPHVPLVVLTGLEDESVTEAALQEGAQGCLIKGQIDPPGLLRALRHAIDRKFMEDALFEEKERAQVTLNSIGDAVVCTDIKGNITFLNVVAEKMTGWPRQEAAGRPMAEVLQIRDATTGQTTPNPMAMAIGHDRAVHLPPNCILVRRDGHEIAIEDSVAPIHDRGGRATGAVIVFRDVQRRPGDGAADGPFRRARLSDGLAQSNAAERPGRPGDRAWRGGTRTRSRCCSWIWMVSNTSTIRWDISTGDKLLQSVARRLVDCVRGSDTVSRQGGDEFVVLLSEVEQGKMRPSRRDECCRRWQKAHSVDEHDLHITTSIGVSVYPDDGLDAETLIKNADTAMYQAKENGRQSYQFFKPAMNVRAVERQSIEEGLRRALGTAGIRAALPAQDRSEDRSDHRRGSVDTLDPPDARADPSGAVYSRRGRLRPHSADRRLGPAGSVRASPGLGGCRAAAGDHGRQRLGDGVSTARAFWRICSQSSTRPASIRDFSSWS